MALLREFGAVQVGTPSADLCGVTLSDGSGWVVTGHHPDILNFVFADEGDDDNHVPIGLLGRSLRAMDAEYCAWCILKISAGGSYCGDCFQAAFIVATEAA